MFGWNILSNLISHQNHYQPTLLSIHVWKCWAYRQNSYKTLYKFFLKIPLWWVRSFSQSQCLPDETEIQTQLIINQRALLFSIILMSLWKVQTLRDEVGKLLWQKALYTSLRSCIQWAGGKWDTPPAKKHVYWFYPFARVMYSDAGYS